MKTAHEWNFFFLPKQAAIKPPFQSAGQTIVQT